MRGTPRFNLDPNAIPCETISPSEITGLIEAVFGAGSPDANAALGKWSNIQKQKAAGDLALVVTKTWDLIDFIVTKQKQNKLPANADSERLGRALFCFAGIDATLPQSTNAWVVYPTDLTRTLVTDDGHAGVRLSGENVDAISLISIVPSADTLNTNLDKYPVVYEFSKYPSNTFASEIIAAVCGSIDVNTPDSVLDRLVLGHNLGGTGFELLNEVPIDFLSCGDLVASNAPTSIGDRLLAMLLPKMLYALGPGASGIGGTLLEFSPIGPVDPRVNVTPNAAGTSAPIGSLVLPSPAVTLSTPNGTLLSNIPVTFAIASGGGSITPASTSSNNAGVASTEWRLGTTTGSNSATATPTTGGGAAVDGVVFVPAARTFTATATGPTGVEISGGPIAGSTYAAGSALPLATVRVVGENNRTVEGYSGAIVASALQGGPLFGTANKTAVAGVATFNDLSIQKAGATQQLRFTAGTLFANTGVFAIGAASAASLTINGGNNQSALIGTVLGVAAGTVAPSVMVKDAYGNIVAGQTVYFSPSNNSATVTPLVNPSSAAGIASATWQLQSGTNEMLASLDATPTLDESRFKMFTATGTTNSTPIVSCAVGNQKDPISQYVVRVDGSNKSVTDAKFYFSITGSANALTPYNLRVDARVYDRYGVQIGAVKSSQVSQVYLRGNNAEQKEANFYFSNAVTSGQNTKIVFTIVPTQVVSGTISFNAGNCSPGNTKCTVTNECKAVNETPIATPLGPVYRLSPAVRLLGY
ncbi:hypothetical protein [Gemmatimonas groenlandica]|uniref:Uncharacterized protein n=1 Tax=Gemmatimonas groenlandica TaxID=2732249 RepID=A0A6M4IQQ4_9BACT|nr:hypothetical protein [Gemmatimonas groenlandica]QJR37060.1 hypothetical protein HKW67_16820 [Gemmatimonas groenlandica]